MLNKVWIFKLHFNSSYSDLNAGNSIFVSKGAKGLIVDDAQSTMAAGSMSLKSFGWGGVGGKAVVIHR